MRRPNSLRASAILTFAGVATLAYAALKPATRSHPVTPSMSEAAGAMAGRRASSASAEGSDGRRHSPVLDSRARPLVVFFIHDGCPCSEAADPFFGKLHAAYEGDAAFLGVIDGDLAMAKDWSDRHATAYPILADGDRRIIADSGAGRSAYVMLVAPGGSVEALWPGYSKAMLAEVGARLARLAGRPEVAIDTEGAPEALASGCSF